MYSCASLADPALNRGQAWDAVVESGLDGRVIATFTRAIYLSFPVGVVALVDSKVDCGPLHARLSFLPQVAVGDIANVVGETVIMNGTQITLPRLLWTPPTIPNVRRAGLLLQQLLIQSPVLDLGAGTDVWERATTALRTGDVVAACQHLVGRGIGLTPAGDDAAAGILLVYALADSDPAILANIADAAPTHEISRAFLRWAARGQAVEPVHDLIAASASGDVLGARQALRRLGALGHTSGLDIAAGVAAAISSLPPDRRATIDVDVQSVR
jgi:hypothetical protein